MPFVRAAPVLLAVMLACSAAHAQVVATIAAPPAPASAVAINATTNRIYVAGERANGVAVIDGATSSAVQQVPVGRRPQYIAVNAATNRIYVSNMDDSTVSVIDGATHAVVTLPIGGAGPIAINERTNKIYVIRQGNNGEVAVIDGAANNWYSINTGSHTPIDLVVNPDTNRLYVSHSSSGDVRAIDASSASDHPPTVSIQIAGHPGYLALNRATNKIYVLSDDSRGPIVEIDGATHAAIPITAPGHASGPRGVVVNPVTNRIYASFFDEVVAVDGATRAVSYIPTGYVGSLAVDTGHNRVYGAGGEALVAIDGATRNFSRLPVSNNQVSGVAVNPATHRIYGTGFATVVFDGNAIGTVAPNYGTNLQGMWWHDPPGSESGWGFYIAHQGNTVFATWFTYDADGSPLWLVIPNATRRSDQLYVGDVYRTTGPPYSAASFNPAAVGTTLVGNLSITLDQAGSGRLILSGTVSGNYIYTVITRQNYASPVPSCIAGGATGAQPNYQDMWWSAPAGGESGWGLSVAHQGDILFAVLYHYDEGGKTLWLVASNVSRTGNGTYSGTLYRTFGPPYTQPWSNGRLTVMPVGSLSLAFPDAANGVLTYTYMGATRSKPITRQAFATPPTACR